MSELTVHQGRQVRKLAFRAPAELSELLGEELMPETPCGGNGTCGKCAVYATGAFSPEPDEAGRVLACQAVVTGDGEGYLPTAYCSDPQGMGIHFTDTACQVWIDYLRTHTD